MRRSLAHRPVNFGRMVTHYCASLDEALRRARKAAHVSGRYYGGIMLPSGRRGFAVYEGVKVLEQYSYVSARE